MEGSNGWNSSQLLPLKTKLLTAILLLSSFTAASATIIQVGSVSFSGQFTLNHLYDFNHPASQPFGWFSSQTVTGSTGIFASSVNTGDTLGGTGALWTVGNLPMLTLPGLCFFTTDVLVTGADSGRIVLGTMNVNGVSGFTFAEWEFIAPPYDIGHFFQDTTGPITLRFVASYDNGHVPDGGNTATTATLMGIGTMCLYWGKRVGENKNL